MAYRERLLERQRTTGRPVRVGLVGAGQMGRGFVAQVRKIAGMEVVAVADVDLQRATGALKSAGIENVITGDDHDTLTNAVAEGGTVAVNDAALLTALPVDMVIDATGVPEIGAQIALRSHPRRQARRPAQRRNRHHRRLAALPHGRTIRRRLHPVPRRRTRRGTQTRRIRPRPRLRRRLRRQRQEQPHAPARHPVDADRRGQPQEDEPQDAGQLRRRLQSHDRDGGAGQRRRPRRGQARA